MFSFAYNGSQYFVYDYLQRIGPKITWDSWPRIIDAPLTLIFIIRRGVLHFLFCQWRLPILGLFLFATYRPQEYARHKTKIGWSSVDPHFATGISTIFNHWILCSPSFTLIWQPVLRFHLVSSGSLHCYSIIHLIISFKMYFTVSTNSG